MEELFHTEFEDGSVEEIAEILYNHKRNFLSGNKESVRSYIASMQNKSCSKTLSRLSVSDEEMVCSCCLVYYWSNFSELFNTYSSSCEAEIMELDWPIYFIVFFSGMINVWKNFCEIVRSWINLGLPFSIIRQISMSFENHRMS